MNKEVIYLEPEDDITDILTKLQRAEQKLVALVPPKKATMLRSAVNMKLVARAAKECDKVAVLVTSDPAIVKLAMAAEIPVAKTLQSRPVVPTPEMVKAAEKDEQIIDEDLGDNASKAELERLQDRKDPAKTALEATESASKAPEKKTADTIDLTDESLEKGSKDPKNAKKAPSDKKIPDIQKYRKWIIAGVVTVLFLVVFGVWALVFAPAVKITVAMSTSSSNFAEDVRLVTNPGTEDVAGGVLYAHKATYSDQYTEEFEATGKEDRGEKATGTVTLSMTFKPAAGVAAKIGLPKGTKLTATTASGKAAVYTLDDDYSVNFDGTDKGVEDVRAAGWTCSGSALGGITACSKTVSSAKVTAVAAGEDYNIGAGRTWNNLDDDDETIRVSNSNAFTGGTTRDVTVATQANIDSAKERILASHTAEGRASLMESLKSDDIVIIESSFAAEAAEVKTKPEVNAEVDENTKPEISIKAVYSVYTVEKSQIEEFVKAKTKIADDQRIYSVTDPYFERFTSIDEPVRLKAIIKTGPTVTEETILEKAKGKKIGEVQALLRSINGVSSVEIKPSYFWVRTVPTDDAKITIELTVEEK